MSTDDDGSDPACHACRYFRRCPTHAGPRLLAKLDAVRDELERMREDASDALDDALSARATLLATVRAARTALAARDVGEADRLLAAVLEEIDP